MLAKPWHLASSQAALFLAIGLRRDHGKSRRTTVVSFKLHDEMS